MSFSPNNTGHISLKTFQFTVNASGMELERIGIIIKHHLTVSNFRKRNEKEKVELHTELMVSS